MKTARSRLRDDPDLQRTRGLAEGAGQLLHRLTSYAPDREWDDPAADARVLQDLEVNDLDRLPFWHERFDEGLEALPLPRELPSTAAPVTAVLAGVHWYDPQTHALVRVGPPPAGSAPALVLTGVPWRTGWKYRERGFRHVYWDAGTLLAQLLARGRPWPTDYRG